jgi:hypothetical protein
MLLPPPGLHAPAACVVEDVARVVDVVAEPALVVEVPPEPLPAVVAVLRRVVLVVAPPVCGTIVELVLEVASEVVLELAPDPLATLELVEVDGPVEVVLPSLVVSATVSSPAPVNATTPVTSATSSTTAATAPSTRRWTASRSHHRSNMHAGYGCARPAGAHSWRDLSEITA